MYVCEHKWRQVPIGGVFPVKEPCLFYYLRKNKQCGNTNIVCVCVCVCVCVHSQACAYLKKCYRSSYYNG